MFLSILICQLYLGALELEGMEVQVQLDDKKEIEDLVPKDVCGLQNIVISELYPSTHSLSCIQPTDGPTHPPSIIHIPPSLPPSLSPILTSLHSSFQLATIHITSGLPYISLSCIASPIYY